LEATKRTKCGFTHPFQVFWVFIKPADRVRRSKQHDLPCHCCSCACRLRRGLRPHGHPRSPQAGERLLLNMQCTKKNRYHCCGQLWSEGAQQDPCFCSHSDVWPEPQRDVWQVYCLTQGTAEISDTLIMCEDTFLA